MSALLVVATVAEARGDTVGGGDEVRAEVIRLCAGATPAKLARVLALLRPAELMRLMGVAGVGSPPPRRPAPPESQFDE